MGILNFSVMNEKYGDVGHRPFAHIVCFQCGEDERMNVQVGSHDLLPDREIRKKFEQRGWDIPSLSTARCPACIEKAKEERKHDAMNKTVIAMPAANAAPRGPSRDEQRIIFEKLNDVYVNETTGDSKGWSDQKVATDMGVPRKWVEDIRAQFFGPIGTNPDMEGFLIEYQEVMKAAKPAIEDARRLRDEVDKLVASPVWNDIPKIADRLARLERTAEQLKKLLP